MVNDRDLILASTSPFRKKQLQELEINFKAIAPNFNEEEFKTDQIKPHDLVKLLAKGKASSLQVEYPHSYIIGSDQLVNFNGEVLGKTASAEQATNQLMKLSGYPHELLTAICLVTPERIFEHVDITTIFIRKLEKDLAEEYVKKHETWNCAGAYKIECQPALIIEKLQTQDPTSIIGLPTFTLVSLLKALQVKST